MAVGPANLLITDMLVSNWNQHECYTRYCGDISLTSKKPDPRIPR